LLESEFMKSMGGIALAAVVMIAISILAIVFFKVCYKNGWIGRVSKTL